MITNYNTTFTLCEKSELEFRVEMPPDAYMWQSLLFYSKGVIWIGYDLLQNRAVTDIIHYNS